jgi:Holliday junction resolvase
MRRAARVDRNHAEIVAVFRRLGCSVLDLAAVGRGCPDILVGCGGQAVLVEIKDGTLSPSRRKLRPAQVEFRANWRGRVVTVETVDQAIALAAEMMNATA